MNKPHIEQNQPNKTFLMGFFVVLGLSSQSGWNAILMGMDFFDSQFQGMNISFYILIPNYVALCLFGILMPKLSGYFSLEPRMVGGLLFQSIFIVLLPIIAVFLPNRQGFFIDLIVSFFLGISSCFVRSSSTGLASMYGDDQVAVFFVGNGFSGILICIFRFISLVAYKDEPGLSILITLSFSAFLNVLALFMFFIFNSIIENKSIQNLINYQMITEEIDNNDDSEQLLEKNQMNFLQTYWWINKLAYPIPLLVLILYLQTYMIYPGIVLKKQFEVSFREWGVAILFFCFNTGDTIGRSFAGFQYYSQTCLFIFVIIRMVQFYPFILIAENKLVNDIIAYMNVFSFAFIHGYITTGLMQLGPQKTNQLNIKEKIGFINGFSLYFGVLIGVLIAVPINKYYSFE